MTIINYWNETDRAGIPVSNTTPLPVAASTAVTANAAAATTSLQIMDDWDESDRAKVNPIVGQAGVAAGSGIRSATTQRVTIATDDTFAYNASATFTPAATSHTAGDVVGGAQTFSLGMPTGATILINSVSIRIDTGTAEATAWRLYLFNVTPPSALADDAAFTLPSGDRASFLGYITVETANDIGDTLFWEGHNFNAQFKLSGTSLFAYLVNDTTFTPAAVDHVVSIYGTSV